MQTTVAHTITQKLPAKAWLVVGLLCVVGCLNYLDRVMITTMRQSIVQSVPMTDAQFGLLTSVFLWVYGILSPIAGYMADRFNRSGVVVISLLVWSGVTFLTAHATTFNSLLLSRALMGVSEACYLPAALALIADYHRGSTRSLAIGIHMAGITVGQSLGFLGGWIAEDYHWSNAFMLFGAIGIVYAIILYFLLRDHHDMAEGEVAKSETRFFVAVKSLFAQRPFVWLLLFWGVLGVAGWMIVGWLPTYYKEHFNLSQTKAGLYATGYMYPLSMAGVILGGFLADRWNKTNPYGRILVPVIGLCIAAPAVFIAGNANVALIAVVGFVTYAFTRVFSDANLMPILCMIANQRYIATGYGLLNMFACIIGGAGIYASGALRDQHVNMSLLFKIGALSILICAGLLYLVKRELVKTHKDHIQTK